MPDDPIITPPPEDALPEVPTAYLAAIGRKGARRGTEAQRAARRANIALANRAKRKLSRERKAALIADYMAGTPAGTIAARFGIAQSTVYSITSRYGATGRKRSPNVPDSVKQEAARAYLAGGGSIAKIGKAYGIWPATLRVWIARERKAAEVAEGEEK